MFEDPFDFFEKILLNRSKWKVNHHDVDFIERLFGENREDWLEWGFIPMEGLMGEDLLEIENGPYERIQGIINNYASLAYAA